MKCGPALVGFLLSYSNLVNHSYTGHLQPLFSFILLSINAELQAYLLVNIFSFEPIISQALFPSVVSEHVIKSNHIQYITSDI